MAYIGIVIMWILILIFCVIGIITVATLIIGLIIRKKHKVASSVLLVVSGVGVAIIIGVLVFIFGPKSEMIKTPSGEVELKAMWISEYRKCLDNEDIKGLREILSKHPEMIHYMDVNCVTLIDYGMYNTNVDIMELAIEYGAVFDNPMVYDRLTFYNSFDSLFNRLDYPDWEREENELHEEGVTTDDIIETVQFMIVHGASLNYGKTRYLYKSFYEEASVWVMLDGFFSDKDKMLLELIEENMAGEVAE